jgi:hypothetical protein
VTWPRDGSKARVDVTTSRNFASAGASGVGRHAAVARDEQRVTQHRPPTGASERAELGAIPAIPGGATAYQSTCDHWLTFP